MKGNLVPIFSEDTLALIPIYENDFKTRIITRMGECLCDTSSKIMLNHNCLINGSSMNGRIKAAKYKEAYTQRIPVCISPEKGLVAIPITSHRKGDSVWVFLHAVKDVISTGKKECSIILINDVHLQVPISAGSFNRQLLRAKEMLYDFSNVK